MASLSEAESLTQDISHSTTTSTSDEDTVLNNDLLFNNLLSKLSLKEEHKLVDDHTTTVDHNTVNPPSLLDKYYGTTSRTSSTTSCSELEDLNYVVEVYGFSSSLKTKDILQQLSSKCSSSVKMKLKWVDDTHALAVYTSHVTARYVAEQSYTKIKTRLLTNSTHKQSIDVAKTVAESIRHYISDFKESDGDKKSFQSSSETFASSFIESDSQTVDRPQSSATVARRMISHALGVKIRPSPEQREKETQLLKEAKEKKQQKRIARTTM